MKHFLYLKKTKKNPWWLEKYWLLTHTITQTVTMMHNGGCARKGRNGGWKTKIKNSTKMLTKIAAESITLANFPTYSNSTNTNLQLPICNYIGKKKKPIRINPLCACRF